MNEETDFNLQPIGIVESSLTDREVAPRQGDEGAPDAWLVIDKRFSLAMEGLAVNDEVIVLTWFHQSDRDVLKVHPRNERKNPLTGVFATRSPDRPNPIGLHPVTILEIDSNRLKVSNLEAIDGTPIVDIKPVI
jgi:tRNA-Thr(GGU) m(6)t(6)A37 methyltransferase TsaA